MRFLPIMLISVFIALRVDAQVAINNDGSSAHPSAILDLNSTSRGLLIPRMSYGNRNGIASPAAGLLVYQTDNTPGVYCYDGGAWILVGAGALAGWSLTGNSGTNPANHFIGTSDNQPLRFRLNNLWAGELNRVSGNVCIGDSSGRAITNGTINTGIGHKALKSNSTGYENTAIGGYALRANTSGTWNVAVGMNALLNNTTGISNTALGAYSLLMNNGSNNTSAGTSALRENTTGINNTAVGSQALRYLTTGSKNTALGVDALFSCSTGEENTAVGKSALQNGTSHYNTAVGFQALMGSTTGTLNVAVGHTASNNIADGIQNTSIGYNSMAYNINGSYNIAVGNSAGPSASWNNTVGIGNAGFQTSGHNYVFLGNLLSTWNGGNVGWSTYSDARVKKQIQEDVKGLDFITRLRPVTYYRDVDMQAELTGNVLKQHYPQKYDIEKIKFSGFLAQEVLEAAQDSRYDFSGVTIPQNDHELYTLRYETFVVPLVKGMQEQQAMIEQQAELIKKLEARIEMLEK